MARPRKHIAIDTELTRTKFIAIRITEREFEAYKAYTRAIGISMSMLLDLALKAYFDKEKGSERDIHKR